MERKRLFLCVEVVAPWPEDLPKGRLLLEADRHLTLVFLGEIALDLTILDSMPKPPFEIGIAGIFDKPLFLPSHSPRVAAWHVKWLEGEDLILQFQKTVADWFKKKGEFLSHVTIAREPFVISEWKRTFKPLPLFTKNIHLCESLGHSRYKVLWQIPIHAPFEEIEHTADIAFHIRGKTLAQISLHAQLALSFYFPPLLPFFDFKDVQSLDELISLLNSIVARADQELGCPFKGVSYHGTVQNDIWEMIVDV